MTDSAPVVIGLDLGTTSTKAVAFTTAGEQVSSASHGYPLETPHPGYAVQDPRAILAAAYAAERGILLADTKFEFGTDEDGRLYIMDEMLTPDSSRYWPADEYEVGTSPPSYDKQFVRDYLETLYWNKTAPGPSLPSEVIERTRAKYAEALQKLAGITVD